MAKSPVIGIIADRIEVQGLSAHAFLDEGLPALTELLDATPVIIPAAGERARLDNLLPLLDGIVLTGAFSGVAPACYGAERAPENTILDPDRDETAFALIHKAIARDIPLFAICRGFQELNVAMGGSLHQYLPGIPGMVGHSHGKSASIQEQYETQLHTVKVQKGGLLDKMGLSAEFGVNSIHYQGVDRLGNGLRVEAVAPDGLVEAVSVPGSSFCLGVQWHPELDYHINSSSVQVFRAFGAAMKNRRS